MNFKLTYRPFVFFGTIAIPLRLVGVDGNFASSIIGTKPRRSHLLRILAVGLSPILAKQTRKVSRGGTAVAIIRCLVFRILRTERSIFTSMAVLARSEQVSHNEVICVGRNGETKKKKKKTVVGDAL
jgi:hypothetical protein